MQTNSGPGWGVIILMFILFWPVGVFLLIKKLSNDRSAVMHSQKGLKIAGIVLVVLGALAILGDAIGGGLFFVIGGGVLIWQANKAQKKGNRYRQYIDLVANRGVSSIDAIAATTNTPVQQVVTDLTDMISRNYFPGAALDMNTRMLVRQPVAAYAPPAAPVQPNQPVVVAAPAPRTIQCGGCGANNTVVGTGVCEYCGSAL